MCIVAAVSTSKFYQCLNTLTHAHTYSCPHMDVVRKSFLFLLLGEALTVYKYILREGWRRGRASSWQLARPLPCEVDTVLPFFSGKAGDSDNPTRSWSLHPHAVLLWCRLHGWQRSRSAAGGAVVGSCFPKSGMQTSHFLGLE